MANGARFRQSHLTAASRAYPLGTILSVSCPSTGRTIEVEVTDRGPWYRRYKLDLSKAAYKALGLDPRRGWAWVTVHKAPANF